MLSKRSTGSLSQLICAQNARLRAGGTLENPLTAPHQSRSAPAATRQSPRPPYVVSLIDPGGVAGWRD